MDRTPSKPSAGRSAPQELDTDSQLAFPSLAPSAPSAGPTKSAWGAGPRIKAAVHTHVFSDTFTLSAIDLSSSGKDGKPATLGEVMKQVISKYKVKLEASANQRTHQTTFHIKADSQKELDKAKRSLLALCSPVVSLHTHLSFLPCIDKFTDNARHQRACVYHCFHHWS